MLRESAIETAHEGLGLPRAHNTIRNSQALIAQRRIDLVGLFRGYISTEWADIQGCFTRASGALTILFNGRLDC
jgi:hypothetical protein